MFGKSRSGRGEPRGPKGKRAYVVGDVHGRLDLLEQLLADIHRDLEVRRPDNALLVFLGDVIDRGPNSSQVVERLRTYRHPGVRPIFILGNHEEILLRVLAGETELMAKWQGFGGAECLKSYGIDLVDLANQADEAALSTVRRAIPSNHVEFLRSFVDTCRFGDYLFVHAGVRPGIGLDQQLQSDLRWIREPFLLSDDDHGFVVVHGHSISPAVDDRTNRIGIDTGAYRTGKLTALAIQGDQRWYLDTAATVEPSVSVTH
jgi:serine/threonine protein phosphatase 1